MPPDKVDYRVSWEIDAFECKDPVQAARYAQHMQQSNRPGYNANVFFVTDESRRRYRVDLADDEPTAVLI